VYRNALPTMIERWRRLDVEVRERIARVERRAWRCMPGELRGRVEALRQQGSRAPEALDDALSMIEALERCRDSLDEALAALDDPAHPWNLPSTDWPVVGFPWMRSLDPSLAETSSAEDDEEGQRALASRVLAIGRGFDPGVELDPVRLPGVRARFRVKGAPMVLDVWRVQGGGFWAGERVELGLLTTARRTAPRLVLRPEKVSINPSRAHPNLT
jgi:hypothetical protein